MLFSTLWVFNNDCSIANQHCNIMLFSTPCGADSDSAFKTHFTSPSEVDFGWGRPTPKRSKRARERSPKSSSLIKPSSLSSRTCCSQPPSFIKFTAALQTSTAKLCCFQPPRLQMRTWHSNTNPESLLRLDFGWGRPRPKRSKRAREKSSKASSLIFNPVRCLVEHAVLNPLVVEKHCSMANQHC